MELACEQMGLIRRVRGLTKSDQMDVIQKYMGVFRALATWRDNAQYVYMKMYSSSKSTTTKKNFRHIKKKYMKQNDRNNVD